MSDVIYYLQNMIFFRFRTIEKHVPCFENAAQNTCQKLSFKYSKITHFTTALKCSVFDLPP